MTDDIDQAVRLAAFRFLDEHGRASDNVFERTLLARGFEFRGTRVRLIGPQGIFKPAILVDRALSLTTIAAKSGQQRPYDDGFSD
ncbi:MAG: hypothetical protein KC560_09165, partial [Myxococcales bacterium]|nr:hypothetical protein [Myxococcales bacterium]